MLDVTTGSLILLFNLNRKLQQMSWAVQRPPVQPQCLSRAPSWIYVVRSGTPFTHDDEEGTFLAMLTCYFPLKCN